MDGPGLRGTVVPLLQAEGGAWLGIEGSAAGETQGPHGKRSTGLKAPAV